MDSNGLDLIALTFGAFNLLRLASYFPQIAAVARDQHGASAISLSCWSIWIGANGSTALYAWVNLQDQSLTTISLFNTLCCAAVVVLAMVKRVTARRRRAEPRHSQPTHLHATSGDGAKAPVVYGARPVDVPSGAPRNESHVHVVANSKAGLSPFSGLCG